jgi:hypothetical protein
MTKNSKDYVLKNHKYHYWITSTNKIIKLSSSNNKSEAKQEALKKLSKHINDFIGKKLILVRLKSVEYAYLTQKEEELNIIGGPIMVRLEHGIIKSKTKISNYEKGDNNILYLSKKYISENKIEHDMKDIVKKYITKKLNQGLFNMNIL